MIIYLLDLSGTLFDTINNIISAIATIMSLIAIVAYFVYTLITNHRKHGFGHGAYLSVITFILLQFPLWGFLILPETLARTAIQRDEPFLTYMSLSALRWFVLFAVLPPLIFLVTQKFSGLKSTITMLVHLSIFLVGWLMGKWFGMIFISLPIAMIFYFLLYHLAQVIYPASNPEEKDEKQNKFWALFWYVWGAQYPVWVAGDRVTRDLEKRIKGDYFKGFGQPGIVWTRPYQVVGQSSGIEFNKVDGPGIMFTEQFERPIAIVDLRTQLRSTVLSAVTKDGVTVKAVLFNSFKIDPDEWDEWDTWDKDERHRIWRASPILKNGLEVDKEIGSYPYSAARIQAAIGTTSIGAATEEEETPDIYWDEIVVQRLKKEARLVLSERRFDEIWVPENDIRKASALDEIAQEIRQRATPYLQESGVKLFTSRIVNFIIDEGDPIRKQLKDTWLAGWDQKIRSVTLDGDTQADKLRFQARTSARSVFLQSITESLNKARDYNENLPKQVVALNFIATLKSLIQDSSMENPEQQITKLETLKEFILRNG